MYRNDKDEIFDNLAQRQDRLDIEFDLLYTLVTYCCLTNYPQIQWRKNKQLRSHSFYMLRIWV